MPGVRLGTGNAGSARILCGAVVPGRARGARGVFQPAEALILLCRRNCALPGVGAQQTATSGRCSRYFSGFINNLMAPVGIDPGGSLEAEGQRALHSAVSWCSHVSAGRAALFTWKN